jgi:hypothetical protein
MCPDGATPPFLLMKITRKDCFALSPAKHIGVDSGQRCGMQQEMKPRLVRVDDFVAETLEAHADKMPPWAKSQAENWRDVAKDLRESESTKMVRVWEEPEPKSVAASMG